MIDRIRSLKSEADRIAAIEALGLGGLSPALRDATVDVERLRDEARSLGIVMDQELIKRASEAQGQIDTLLLATTALGACASSTRIVTPAVGCSNLLPAGWADPVPSAAFPQDAASVRDWQVFGVDQSGQLAKANGRTSDVIGIVRACEARDAEAVERIGRPWWARLRPG